MSENVHPIQPRVQVLFRTLCLSAFVMRGLMEQIIATREDEVERGRAITRARVLNRWLDTQGLAEHRSEREAALLSKEPGTWHALERAEASWRVEALGVLVWAIQQVDDIPPYDTLFDSGRVLDSLPNVAPIESFLRYMHVRESGIPEARDIAEIWHWRARLEELRRTSEPLPEGQRYEARIAHVTQGAYAHGAIPEPVEGDFPALGAPYAALSPTDLVRLQALAYQRHFALNWLCTFSPEWDSTPTNT